MYLSIIYHNICVYISTKFIGNDEMRDNPQLGGFDTDIVPNRTNLAVLY
jgi:hypothetical protein